MVKIEELLKTAAESNASDIFITVGVPPTYKINGALVPANSGKLIPADTERLVRELFRKQEDFEQFLAIGEKDFSISLAGIGRFRVDAYTQRGSLAAAVRVMRFELPNPAELGIPQTVLDFHKKSRGLVLVTGPTGSGKSTTITALIDLINRERSCHILTLEDPIEHLHHHEKSIVDQREIGVDTQNYAKALRSALRQAPDVILVGEMRDLETISIALTAAETGQLVLSTLHTVGAAKTIDRIIDVFPTNQQEQVKFQLSTVLQAVVSQQLIPSEKKGRVAAFEIMVVNSAIRNMIRESKIMQIDTAIQMGRSQGMVGMDASIAQLYNDGLISREDALTYCMNSDAIMKFMQ
ncbi:MAG: PilT/PilU family type 4a pilus ATPase [Clostridiales bacterium]|nr:PilT/PilU family type 4a pilus ATPase [Clostridiales bacterium]